MRDDKRMAVPVAHNAKRRRSKKALSVSLSVSCEGVGGSFLYLKIALSRGSFKYIAPTPTNTTQKGRFI